MDSSKPASAGLPAASGSWWLAYTPANAASVSALAGEIAAARPAMLTWPRPPGRLSPQLASVHSLESYAWGRAGTLCQERLRGLHSACWQSFHGFAQSCYAQQASSLAHSGRLQPDDRPALPAAPATARASKTQPPGTLYLHGTPCALLHLMSPWCLTRWVGGRALPDTMGGAIGQCTGASAVTAGHSTPWHCRPR